MRKITPGSSAPSPGVRKDVIQQMAFALGLDSAYVNQDGKEKIAQNVLRNRAVRTGHVHSHMSAIVRKDLQGICVTNQTAAMDAMKQTDIVPSLGSASARLGSKADFVTSVCLTLGV